MDAVKQFLPILVVLLLVGWAGWFFFLRTRKEQTYEIKTPALTGIAGWLLPVAIGQALGPVAILLQTLISFKDYEVIWKARTVLVLGEIALNAAFFLFVVWCSINFFKKRREFPVLFIWELWLAVAVPIIDILWVAHMTGNSAGSLTDEKDMKEIFRALVFAIVWTLYALKSVRVKNTFVN